MSLLKYYKLYPDVEAPSYGTELSACFDIKVYLNNHKKLNGVSFYNKETPFAVGPSLAGPVSIILRAGDRVMIPTGMIFDIPETHSLRFHIRSGTSFKKGIVLANQEAVIDPDYPDETFILIRNVSENSVHIAHGDRLVQGELVPLEQCEFEESLEKPAKKTSRSGGMGSTGV